MSSICTDSIQDGTEITQALTGLSYPFVLTPDENEMFIVSLDTSQTIYTKILISSASSTTSIVFVNFIRKDTLETVRSIKIRASTIITTDLDMGEYYICVRTLLGTFDIELNVTYLRYARDVTFDNISMYHGEYSLLNELKIKRREIECNQPLKYTMISGKLPTGLSLDSKGRIYGTLPIIDNENVKDIPSFNLYHSNFDYATPIGVRYEFTVKLELEEGVDDSIFDIRTFCLMIVNDWSLTEPYLGAEIYDITGEVDDISKTLIPKSLCPPCVLTLNDDDTATYIYDSNGAVLLADRINADMRWTYNDYGSITKGNYVSRTPLIKDIIDMNYVIDTYEISGDTIIDIPSEDLVTENEYIILPDDVRGNDIYKWIVTNLEMLVNNGYNKNTLNKYINKELDGKVSFRDNKLNLDLIVDEYAVIDPQVLYTQEHEKIMMNEPMYIRGTFIPYELTAVITYEQYR